MAVADRIMRMRIVAAAFFLFTSALFLFAQNTRVEGDRIAVYKQQRELVLQRGGEPARSYKIAPGSVAVAPRLVEIAIRVAPVEHIKTRSVSPVVPLGRPRHFSSLGYE
jgi:hypothetical protein